MAAVKLRALCRGPVWSRPRRRPGAAASCRGRCVGRGARAESGGSAVLGQTAASAALLGWRGPGGPGLAQPQRAGCRGCAGHVAAEELRAAGVEAVLASVSTPKNCWFFNPP